MRPARKSRSPRPPSRATGLEIDAPAVCSRIERFIRDQTRRAELWRVVVGLSGGIDSAVAATLAQRALGLESVLALLMPYRTSRPDSQRDAEDLARRLGIRYEVVDISPAVDLYFQQHPDADRVRRGNKMARERMSILFDYSAAHKALVLGTSNRTEILLGYGTHFGDTACSLNPIGNLYKTQVRQLARCLGVPERILRKAPTADLWPDQTDESELGFTYEEIDRLLVLMVDRGLKLRQLQARGFNLQMVRAVQDRIERNKFKRRMPFVAPVAARR